MLVKLLNRSFLEEAAPTNVISWQNGCGPPACRHTLSHGTAVRVNANRVWARATFCQPDCPPGHLY
jgi:hypothetical protein